MSKVIRIGEPKVLKRSLLLSNISCSRNIEKYFWRKSFWVKYDVDITGVDESILNIPVLSNVVTVAWATGADVYVGKLDKSYFEALENVRLVFKRWYPKLPFSTKIYVEKLVSNNFQMKNVGLLFSGGVDSFASYIKHREKKPSLIMIWGADIPISYEDFWKKVKDYYESFARQEIVEINFVKTNLHEFINEGSLNVEFGRFITGSWWGGFHHGISLLGLCAPLTVVKRINRLLIASSIAPEWYAWGSHWLVDNKIRWANVKIYHDGYRLSRQKKIRKLLKEFLKNNNFQLRVCYSQFRSFNCNRCEKCRRTITALTLEGIDPNEHGFKIDDDFFERLKLDITQGHVIKDLTDFLLWRDIQMHIPKEINHDLYNSKVFFEWFRDFNIVKSIKNLEKRFSAKWALFYVYYRSPKNLRQATAKLLRPLAKNIFPR